MDEEPIAEPASVRADLLPVPTRERSLEAVDTVGGAVELVDPSIGHWLVRFEPVPSMPTGNMPAAITTTAALRMTDAVAQHVPQLASALRESPALRVVFSPAATKGLREGTLRLIDSPGGLPVARSASGAFAEWGRIANPQAAFGMTATAAAGVTLPVLLPMVIGVAAAAAQQRQLEKSLGRLQGSLDRIESRLRDDDLGVLDTADRLSLHIRDELDDGYVPQQLRLELAIARMEVSRIYESRRRFVERFKTRLEIEQVRLIGAGDHPNPWVPFLADDIREEEGVVDELVTFVRSMATRARLTACNAVILSLDNGASTALRELDVLDTDLRRDYHDLNNRVRALAAHPPEPTWRHQLPLLHRSGMKTFDFQRLATAHEKVSALHDWMNNAVGDSLPDRETELSVVVPLRSLPHAV